jgi:hypothetical protein
MGLEDRVEELEEKVEELEKEVTESCESEQEDSDRTLYLYVYYVEGVQDTVLGEMEERKFLILEDSDGYNVPNEVESPYASTTRQVISLVKSLGFDCWELIEKVGAKEDAIYYEVRIRKENSTTAEEGIWFGRRKAEQIITDLKAREYL